MGKSELSYIEARDILINEIVPTQKETVEIEKSAGRILAQDLIALEDVPCFERSPYDGYALRAEDSSEASSESPVVLEIIESVGDGQLPTKRVTQGTAIRLTTGSLVPEGADAICQYEKTEFTEKFVKLSKSLKKGDNIVRIGEDVQKGTVLAKSGEIIDEGTAGSLAAQGITEPMVYRMIKVGVISTGHELVHASQVPKAGFIRDSNSHTMTAALIRAGFKAVNYGIAGNSIGVISDLLNKALKECDALVMTGGAASGGCDFAMAAMKSAGAKILFSGVNFKPGMSCVYAVRDGKLICGLSGNPSSALTNLYAVGMPALKYMAGHRKAVRDEITVTLKNDFPKRSRGVRLLHGYLDLSNGAVEMVLPEKQGNVVISSMIGCEVIAVVPAGSGPLKAGEQLKAFLI